MSSPNSNEHVDGSLPASEKEQLLQRIKFWEDKYGELDSNFQSLNKKFEEEVKKNSPSPPPQVPLSSPPSQDPLSEVAAMRQQILVALQEFRNLAEEVRSSSASNNKARIEEIDQYGRRNILLLHFLSFPNDKYGIEFIKWIVYEINKLFPDLDVPLQLSHIDDAHPLKTKKDEHPVVIVKFANRWMKNEIYKKRSQLKDSPYKKISITEQLTSNTQDLLETTRSIVGEKNKVFTNNCVISLKFNNRKYSVRSFKDLQFLARKIGYKHPLPPPGLHKTVSHTNIVHPVSGNFDPLSAMNTEPFYSMHPSQFNPYHHSLMHPQGRPSHIGRGNDSVWNKG